MRQIIIIANGINSQTPKLQTALALALARYFIITPWALLGEASRRRAQGCNSSDIEEWLAAVL